MVIRSPPSAGAEMLYFNFTDNAKTGPWWPTNQHEHGTTNNNNRCCCCYYYNNHPYCCYHKHYCCFNNHLLLLRSTNFPSVVLFWTFGIQWRMNNWCQWRIHWVCFGIVGSVEDIWPRLGCFGIERSAAELDQRDDGN